MPMLHPTDDNLIAMAQDSLPMSERGALFEHLTECQRCRNYVQDVRELSGAVKSENAPSASDALLARIQSSRVAGVRVMLNDPSREFAKAADIPVRSSVRYRIPIAVGIAASLALVTLETRSTQSDIAVKQSRTVASIGLDSESEFSDAMLDAFNPLPTIAHAQDAPLTAAPLEVNASQLRPGTWTYTSSNVIDDVVARPHSVKIVSLDRVSYLGAPAWLLIESTVSRHTYTDSVWLEGTTLRPLARVWHVGYLTFSQTFHRDHVTNVSFHKARTDKGRDYTNTTNSVMNPTGIVIAQTMQLAQVLRTQRLHAHWVANLGSPGPMAGPSMQRSDIITARVDGQATISVPYGKIDCWRVTFGRGQEWFVSKQTGDVIRIGRMAQGGKGSGQLDLLTAQ